jgi:hypothetical protein
LFHYGTQISTGKEISESECTFSVGSMRSGSAAGSRDAADGEVAPVPGFGVAEAPGGDAVAGGGADFAPGGGSAAEPVRLTANPNKDMTQGAVLMYHSA